ncbi:MAG: hypothetical protein RL376_1941 [Verrucomicrobiota bacterium]|jgi:1-phosphofructokinase
MDLPPAAPASAAAPALVATVTLNPAIDRTLVVSDFRTGAVNRAQWAGERAGGKGVNVAAALAAQRVRCVALGFLGADNAQVFETFFAGLGIEDACQRLPGATRVGLKLVDPVRGETTDLNFPGLAPGAGDLAELGRRLEVLNTQWCVLAGSLPPGVAVDFYAKAARCLRSRGVRVGVDTSGEALRHAAAAGPDFIKPNVHELSEWAGRSLRDEAEVVAAARELCLGGVGLVVVSLGAEGAVFVTEKETVRVRPPVITVRSTVGAGDAMVAGVVAAQLAACSLADTARVATEFSIRALLRGEAADVIAEAVSRVRVG